MPTGSSASGLRGAAHDHPAGRLDLHAIALVRDEVPAAEYVFKEPEEHLDDPPLSVVLRDQFSAISSPRSVPPEGQACWSRSLCHRQQ